MSVADDLLWQLKAAEERLVQLSLDRDKAKQKFSADLQRIDQHEEDLRIQISEYKIAIEALTVWKS